MITDSERLRSGWLNHRAFVNVDITDLRARHVDGSSLSAEIVVLEKGNRYTVYSSSPKPPSTEVAWIDRNTEPVPLKIRSSDSLILVIHARNKELGETQPIRIMKAILSTEKRDGTSSNEIAFGPYSLHHQNRVFGSCLVSLRFGCMGGCIPLADNAVPYKLNFFETTAVGHQTVLRWFSDVMSIMFDQPMPLSVKLTQLTFRKLCKHHQDAHSTLVAHGSALEDVLAQMKTLLFALKSFPNLTALKCSTADLGMGTTSGNQPNTIGDLCRLIRLPPDVRERLGGNALYITGGLLRELADNILKQLCLSSIMLEEYMWDYQHSYQSFPSSLELRNCQTMLYITHFRAVMFLSQNCTVPIALDVKSVVEVLLYYIHGESGIPDHQRHYTHALIAARGDVGEEVQAMLHSVIGQVKTATSRNKLRRLLTSLVQRSNQAPGFLLLPDVKAGQALGGGGFADVHVGEWNKMNIAIKSLKSIKAMPDNPESRAKLFLEVITWKTLQHPRVLEFCGIADIPTISPICMISPLMAGTVRARFYLDSEHGGAPLPADKSLGQRILKEVAEGMAYLHEEGVIHGDLRADNLFLDSEDHVKIADFGLCVFSDGISQNYFSMRSGNARWAAPELVDSRAQDAAQDPQRQGMIKVHRPKEPCDIFSFACVCVEIYSRAAPYDHLLSEVAVIHFLTSQVDGVSGRPNRPHELVNNDLWSLMQRCWDARPEGRPRFPEIVAELQRVFLDI